MLALIHTEFPALFLAPATTATNYRCGQDHAEHDCGHKTSRHTRSTPIFNSKNIHKTSSFESDLAEDYSFSYDPRE